MDNRTHTLIEAPIVDAPAVPDALTKHALRLAGEAEAVLTPDREHILRTCVDFTEKQLGRLVWRSTASNGVRRATSLVHVEYPDTPIDACPWYPDTAGCTVSLVSVTAWDRTAGDWGTTDAMHRVLPVGRVVVQTEGDYRIIADFTPPTSAPSEAVEATARLYSLLDNRRPGGGDTGGLDVDGRILNLDGAWRRSGAYEILQQLRTRWVT